MSPPHHAPRILLASTASALALVASSALAEPSAADRAAGTALFQEGRKLMQDKDYPAACRKFEESERLDPGGGTLLNLALCHEAEGKTATAWSELNEALGIARKDGRQDRITLAESHIAGLEASLSRLTITVPSPTPDLEVKRDGSVLGRGAWGTAIPVDPGEHLIEASAPGRASWSAKVSIGSSKDARTVVVPTLVDAAATAPAVAPTAAPEPVPSLTASSSPPLATGASRETGNGANTYLGYSLLGVGVVGVAVGSYFGLRAISKHHSSDDHCTPGCDADGSSLENQARTSADVSTAAFTIGLVAAGVGAGVLLFSPSTSVAPTVGRDGVGLTFRGSL